MMTAWVVNNVLSLGHKSNKRYNLKIPNLFYDSNSKVELPSSMIT